MDESSQVFENASFQSLMNAFVSSAKYLLTRHEVYRGMASFSNSLTATTFAIDAMHSLIDAITSHSSIQSMISPLLISAWLE